MLSDIGRRQILWCLYEPYYVSLTPNYPGNIFHSDHIWLYYVLEIPFLQIVAQKESVSIQNLAPEQILHLAQHKLKN